MTDDVVSELDAWLGAWEGPDDYRLTVQRARDEIVALRERLAFVEMDRNAAIERSRALNHSIGRDEALEEAAQKAEHYEAPIWSAMIAAAIRTLKEKH